MLLEVFAILFVVCFYIMVAGLAASILLNDDKWLDVSIGALIGLLISGTIVIIIKEPIAAILFAPAAITVIVVFLKLMKD